jgi:hypothetical protein
VIIAGIGRLDSHPNQDIAMTTFRHRMTVAALTLLAAGLSACANDSTAPFEPTDTQRVSADVDTSGRRPTQPWTSVTDTTGRRPTQPWTKVSQDTRSAESY